MRNRWLIAIGLCAAIAAVVGWTAYDKLFRRVVPEYASDADHFKYGSIGNDGQGLPYPIWVVLPKLFPENLPGPGGYLSVGFRWEDGRAASDAPIGFARTRVGVERISITCAVCHLSSYRREEGGKLEFVLA